MPSLNAEALGKSIVAAWKTIAGTHWKAVRELSQADLKFLSERAKGLADDLVAGRVTREQAAMEKDDMIESLRGLEDVLAVEGKVLAQDLINAALGIIGGAVNTAAGVKVF